MKLMRPLHASFRRPSPAFSIQNLRYALAAADYGNFRRAAEALLLRQSTLSRCVRQLEEWSAWPCSKGRAEAWSNPSGPSVPSQRALNFGAGGSARGENAEHGPRRGRQAYGRVLHVPRRRKSSRYADRRFPTISAARARNVRELAPPARHALRNGVVDIAIIPGAMALPESKTMSLWSERVLVGVPEGHPLADREPVHWIDLREEKILLSRRDPGPELGDLLIAKVTSPGDRPRIVRHRAGLANLKISLRRLRGHRADRGLRRRQFPRCDLS